MRFTRDTEGVTSERPISKRRLEAAEPAGWKPALRRSLYGLENCADPTSLPRLLRAISPREREPIRAVPVNFTLASPLLHRSVDTLPPLLKET